MNARRDTYCRRPRHLDGQAPQDGIPRIACFSQAQGVNAVTRHDALSLRTVVPALSRLLAVLLAPNERSKDDVVRRFMTHCSTMLGSPPTSARKTPVHALLTVAALRDAAGGGPSSQCLVHPVDESIDALAYSVAWYATEAACARYAPSSQAAALEKIPLLVAGRPTNFDDCLRFCRSLFHGLFKILCEAVHTRYSRTNPAIGDAVWSDVVPRVSLRILVDSAIDVMTLLSSRRDAAAETHQGDDMAHTPSKVLAASSPPSSPSFVSFRRARDGEGIDLDASAASPGARVGQKGRAALSMAELLTPCTLINLLSCAFMDSLVALTVTDVDGMRRYNTGTRGPSVEDAEEEMHAANAFFIMSMVVGTDPDDLLAKFLEYARAAPYPIRRVWVLGVERSLPVPSGSLPTTASADGVSDGVRGIRGRRDSTVPTDVAATAWASTSRRLVLQRSVVGMLLESAGPSLASENAAVAQLWRYASCA